MITFSILFIILYSYSVYKIRKDSDSWEYFDPSESNIFVHLMFVFGTGALIVGIALLVVYMIANNIVP
jgi:hypothetical protein